MRCNQQSKVWNLSSGFSVSSFPLTSSNDDDDDKSEAVFPRQHISSVNKLCWRSIAHYLTWTIMTIDDEAKKKNIQNEEKAKVLVKVDKQTRLKDKLFQKCENFSLCFCRTFLGKFIMLPCLELFLFLSNIVLLLSWEERWWVWTEPSGKIEDCRKNKHFFYFPSLDITDCTKNT